MVYDIKVIPRAKRSEVIGAMADGALKVKVAAVPEDNKANEELIRTLATHFQVPANTIKILSGHTSTRKRLQFSTL
jgi:hypothetical protein